MCIYLYICMHSYLYVFENVVFQKREEEGNIKKEGNIGNPEPANPCICLTFGSRFLELKPS